MSLGGEITSGGLKKKLEYRSLLRSALLLLTRFGKGAGMASPETIKGLSERMESGVMQEGEWFALECQGRTLIYHANALWESLTAEEQNKWLETAK